MQSGDLKAGQDQISGAPLWKRTPRLANGTSSDFSDSSPLRFNATVRHRSSSPRLSKVGNRAEYGRVKGNPVWIDQQGGVIEGEHQQG